jgi:hypothetical protein
VPEAIVTGCSSFSYVLLGAMQREGQAVRSIANRAIRIVITRSRPSYRLNSIGKAYPLASRSTWHRRRMELLQCVRKSVRATRALASIAAGVALTLDRRLPARAARAPKPPLIHESHALCGPQNARQPARLWRAGSLQRGEGGHHAAIRKCLVLFVQLHLLISLFVFLHVCRSSNTTTS